LTHGTGAATKGQILPGECARVLWEVVAAHVGVCLGLWCGRVCVA
jgi:hypothetical protein